MKHLDFMIMDEVSLFIAFSLSYWLKFSSFDFMSNEAWPRLLLIILLLNIIITFFTNPYSGIFRRSYYQETKTAFMLTATNLVSTSVLIYLFKMGGSFSREMFFVMYGLYFVLSLILKYIWKKLLVSRKLTINTTKPISLFIICDSRNIEKVLNDTNAGDLKLYTAEGIYLIDSTQISSVAGVPVISGDYVGYILSKNIGDVLISVPTTRIPSEDLQEMIKNGINIHINIESVLGFQTEDQYITNIGVYKTLNVGGFSFTPNQMLYLGIKRFADILFGLAGIVLLIPVAAVVKLVYVCSGDKDTILYRQKRVGQNGKQIRIWKFRSMVPNAEDMLQELLKDSRLKKEWEENQKIENDPRITKVGHILRKTSIDELPQLINVFVGDMSLVGPRPLVKGELETHNGLKLYERVKPGITGWWGCNGRNDIDYRERLELEYYYVKNCSLYLDILCLARTVIAVLKKTGAK